MPPTHYFDVHLGHTLKFQHERSVEVSVDIFNVLDLQSPVTYYENDDQNFGLTLYRQEPRSIRAMLKGTY
jgi:hypothetical protein